MCIRRAWLVMGSRSVELEDEGASYFCTELDLGYPEVRDVTNNRPDSDGVDDRTALMGSRAISANITARAATMTADEIGTLFAPFMLPAARPELHYVLDRPGTPERMVVVRASGYTWPVSGSRTREIHLGWVAPDPVLRDPEVRTSSSHTGTPTAYGRVYPLVFDRAYVVGGSAPTTGVISSPGDVPIRPLLRIFGPITDPVVTLEVNDPDSGPLTTYTVAFVPGFRIDTGHWLDFDAGRKTVWRDSDPRQDAMADVDWDTTTWPALPTEPAETYLNLTGASTSGVSQCEAVWTDGYLS